jgi:hypothetical protein
MSDLGAVSYATGVAVTPSDSEADPAGPFFGFYSGVPGSSPSIKVTTVTGDTVVFASPAAGIVIPLAISRVWSTGTTNTGIIGLKGGARAYGV